LNHTNDNFPVVEVNRLQDSLWAIQAIGIADGELERTIHYGGNDEREPTANEFDFEGVLASTTEPRVFGRYDRDNTRITVFDRDGDFCCCDRTGVKRMNPLISKSGGAQPRLAISTVASGASSPKDPLW
jgi:hypothetical protein